VAARETAQVPLVASLGADSQADVRISFPVGERVTAPGHTDETPEQHGAPAAAVSVLIGALSTALWFAVPLARRAKSPGGAGKGRQG
jgi:hypothetical protein